MKTTFLALLSAAFLASAGCENKSPPGGPGSENNTSHHGTPDDSFQLTLPTGTTDIRQGDTKGITVGIVRGKNFDQDVTIDVTDLPKGVTADQPEFVIKAGDKDGKFSLTAAKDAALGDHDVKVTGTPMKGGPKTFGQFKIKVKEAK